MRRPLLIVMVFVLLLIGAACLWQLADYMRSFESQIAAEHERRKEEREEEREDAWRQEKLFIGWKRVQLEIVDVEGTTHLLKNPTVNYEVEREDFGLLVPLPKNPTVNSEVVR